MVTWYGIWLYKQVPADVLMYPILTLIARFMGPAWGPSEADRTQVGPMLAPWTLLSGKKYWGVWSQRACISKTRIVSKNLGIKHIFRFVVEFTSIVSIIRINSTYSLFTTAGAPRYPSFPVMTQLLHKSLWNIWNFHVLLSMTFSTLDTHTYTQLYIWFIL